MKAVTGVFNSSSEGRHAILKLRALGISDENLNFLTPSDAARELTKVPTLETEQPGMGKAIGAVVGGVTGAALGPIGLAFVSLLVPGVGAVAAAGLYAAALLGVGGAAAGAAVGGTLEDSMSDGLPKDELFVYEDALRRGRTVVIALAKDDEQAEAARTALEEVGAETIDAARKQWWIGLRDAEAERYSAGGRDFTTAESVFQEGFTAALHPDLRGRKFTEARRQLRKRYREIYDQEPFRHGYERGEHYYRSLQEKYSAGQPV
jgi:hypothetical protein